MRQVIDKNNWERWNNFRFFQDFLNPYYTITVEVECGEAKQRTKTNKESFFLYYLYAILRAVNEQESFRYRLEGERFEEIVRYDIVDIMTNIRVDKEGTFYTVRIPYRDSWEDFQAEARHVIDSISSGSDPFEVERKMLRSGHHDVILVSAVPDLYFTGLANTQKHRAGTDFPIISVGKLVEREGKQVMPVAISVHHGFVDGFHISCFVKKVEEYLVQGF